MHWLNAFGYEMYCQLIEGNVSHLNAYREFGRDLQYSVGLLDQH